MDKKAETIKIMKETRSVPDKLKDKLKIFNKQKNLIKKTLSSGAKSIPMIAKETGILSDRVVYVLMSLYKYDEILVDRVDDMDEFYLYKLNMENQNE